MTCKHCGLPKPMEEFRNYAPRGWCTDCRMERSRLSQQKSREQKAYELEQEMWMRVSAATVNYSAEVTRKLVDRQWEYWERDPRTAYTKRLVLENARLWELHRTDSCGHTPCPFHKHSVRQMSSLTPV